MVANVAVPFGLQCTPDDEFASDACHERHGINLLNKGILDGVAVEEVLPNSAIRPDITLKRSSEPRGLIEIVDTHAPEQHVIDTALPIQEVHVSDAQDLEVLASGAIPVARMHNYRCPNPFCKLCGNRKSEGCRSCKVCKSHLERSFAMVCGGCVEHALRRAGFGTRAGGPARFRTISNDRFDNALWGATHLAVNANARRLADLGFQQQPLRASLFRIDINLPGFGKTSVYGDLGGTEDVKIWESEGIPALYAFPKHPKRDDILNIIGNHLEKRGIPNRRHLPDVMGWGDCY